LIVRGKEKEFLEYWTIVGIFMAMWFLLLGKDSRPVLGFSPINGRKV